ncbi:MAG: hypothetical protein IJ519_05340 [Clostridia bacterium]|nr:hypothetical protein [Clostridia bacterium]
MKKLPKPLSVIILILINAAPFAFNILTYQTGVISASLRGIIVTFVLVAINFLYVKGVVPFLLTEFLSVAATALTGYVCTYLYYHNVSSDHMSLVVGEILTQVQAGILLAVVLLTAIAKFFINRNDKANDEH